MFHPKHSVFTLIFLWICEKSVGCQKTDGCTYDETFSTLNCRSYVEGSFPNAKTLHLCKYENTTLYLSSVIKKLPRVENITITSSNLSYLREPGKENNIKQLRINNSTLKRIPDNFFLSMRKLREFDVRNNSLGRLPLRMKYVTHLEAIYLENNKWNCSLNMDWALELNRTIIKDYSKLKCYGEPYPDKPLVPVAIFLQNAQVNCPSACKCSMSHVVRDRKTEKLQPIIEANCSDKGFTILPALLPNNTNILRLEKNLISDLTPLIANKIYRKVTDLYLDDNLVESIANLEGSYWLSHFRLFSLNSNKLTKMPTYAVDNALQQNPNMPNAVRIFLGGNPWRCDCLFTPHFQEMLMKYENQIGDIDRVKCSFVEGDENSMRPILSLSRVSVCRSPNEYSIRPLDLVNIVLASLIVFILSKLAYDYYNFKKTGRLPWIVTKMP